jgi:hypothetical protein
MMMMENGKVKNPRLERLMEICEPFPYETYESIDNNRLAVYSISFLSENNVPVTQEAVTVALYLMFPQKFSLVGFSEYPDAERVNRTLLQLGPKYRNWAVGNKHVGYSINETGRLVTEQTKKLLMNPGIAKTKKTTPSQARTLDPNLEVKEIEETSLFKAYKSGQTENLDEFAIWELMRSFPNTPKSALAERLKRMMESARLSGRGDLTKFLDWVKKRFLDLFKEEEQRR